MDRSLLSRPEVIAASRLYVCARLATYEDAEEMAFCRSLFTGGSGDVENTTFALLGPDGRRVLLSGTRSASFYWATPAQMAYGLNHFAAPYATQPLPARAGLELPTAANVRLALDIASADDLPLVVLYARDAGAAERLKEKVRTLAWSDAHIGRFIYAETRDAADLATVEGVPESGGLLVIQPDRFGLKGAVMLRAAADAPAADLARALTEGARRYQRFDKVHEQHVRAGQRAGQYWETALPVTDPHEAGARARGRAVRGGGPGGGPPR